MRLRLYCLISERTLVYFMLSVILAACGGLAVTPQSAQRLDPALDYQVIETERIIPAWFEVRDFEFSSSSVIENASPFHRATELLLQSSAEERSVEIARATAASLSEQAVKRLDQAGLMAIRIRYDSEGLMAGDNLLVTGRLIDVDEGNRLTRVAVGLGAGESTLDTEVHVFRVAQGERAEVLSFTTHADSGRMPGLGESMGFGVFFIGPITALTALEEAASTGQKIYSTEMDYLASETGDQIADYLLQYSADESWIPANKAKSVNLVTD